MSMDNKMYAWTEEKLCIQAVHFKITPRYL